MAEPKDLWGPGQGGAPAAPPLDEATLALCEAKYGVKFPPSFVELYMCQNGGVLRDCEWPEHLMPLAEDDTAHFGMCIRPLSSYAARGEILDDDALDWIEEEYGDPGLVFVLWSDGHVCCTLNFNKRGPTGEPSVVYLDFECISDEELADTFGDWLASLFRAEDAPSVDWSEASRCAVLAEETVEVRYLGSDVTETVEQVLSADGDQLILFTRTRRSDGDEQLAKVMLPRGINPGLAHVSPFRPPPCPTFTLHLQPAELDDIEWVTSRRTSQGDWRNGESRGVPIYCTFESADRSRLEALRNKLLGGKIPKSLIAEEEMQARWATMSQEEQQSGFAQQLLAAVEQMDEMFDEQGSDLGPVPDELKVAAKHLEGLKKQMLKDLKRMAGAAPVDADTAQLIRDSLAEPTELVDAPQAAAPPGTEQADAPPAPFSPFSTVPAELSEADEARLAKYESLAEEIVTGLESVSDEASAREAVDRLADKVAELGSQATEMSGPLESIKSDPAKMMAFHQRLAQPSMRIHEQLYRIQHSVPAAAADVQRLMARLVRQGPQPAAPPVPELPPHDLPLGGASETVAGPDTDVTSQLAALVDEFTGVVAGASDEQAAQEAIEKMQARADEYRSLFTQFTNQSGLVDKLRLRPAEQRLQEAVQRVQLLSSPAHAMIESFLNELLLCALQPGDPDSDEARLLARWEAVSCQLIETLRTILDEGTACDVLPQLEEQTREYEACYRQFIDRIDDMETMQAGIVMQGRAASRSALHQELHRIRHQVPAAYKHLRDLGKRLRETGL